MIVSGLIVAILCVPGPIRLGIHRFATFHKKSAYAHISPAAIDHPPQDLQRIVSINRITIIYSIMLGAITATATMFNCVTRRLKRTTIYVPPGRRSLAGFTRWMSKLVSHSQVLIVWAIIVISTVSFALVHAAVGFAMTIVISAAIVLVLAINIVGIVRPKELRLATVRATASNDFSDVGDGTNKPTSRWYTRANDDEERHPRNQRTRPTRASPFSAGHSAFSLA